MIPLLWAGAALPIFWASVRLHPRTQGADLRGWGLVAGGHLLLAAFIPYVVEVGQHAVRAGMYTLWPPPDPPDESPFHPVQILLELEFLSGLAPYLILLVVGLGRYEYVRSRARREQAEALEREAEQLRSQLTEARLESLRMQINPHFFHNTLHTISTMAGRDPEGIRRATARLSDLMRYVLSTSDQQEVTLDEELDVLESYLDIQKLRLDDRFDVTFDIDPEARPALVPTLLLQPLAENAVKHGFEGADEPGHLTIRAARDDDTLVLEIADDGPGLPEDGASAPDNGRPAAPNDDGKGVGLQNIAERLDGLYGDAASLDFDRADGGGLRVLIRLAFHVPESERSLRASWPTETSYQLRKLRWGGGRMEGRTGGSGVPFRHRSFHPFHARTCTWIRCHSAHVLFSVMADAPSLSVLVVDDERYARERLVERLEPREEVETMDRADSGDDAVEALRTNAYDLVFLDVQMPERTGLEVIETLGPSNMPPTIFVTAYDQYALQAFEYAALDYLLKPFDDDRFEQAFRRGLEIRSLQEAEAVADRFRRLLDASDEEVADASSSGTEASADPDSAPPSDDEEPHLQRLTIDLPGKVRVVPVDEIQYITAEDAYVKIHTGEEACLLRERMHVLEDRLDPSDFARIHRSTIVRLGLIEAVHHRSGGDYVARLETGEELDVSRSRHKALLTQLETGLS